MAKEKKQTEQKQEIKQKLSKGLLYQYFFNLLKRAEKDIRNEQAMDKLIAGESITITSPIDENLKVTFSYGK